MNAAGRTKHSPLAKVVSLAVAVVALALALYAHHRSTAWPSTDDATIDADVVHVAAAIGGRVLRIAATENASVEKGDVLFEIDPIPYQHAVEQARAELDLAEATLASQQRLLSTQQSAATIAKDQIRRATANLELATRTLKRLRPLATSGYVATQHLDQAEVAERDATTSLAQAKEQESAAVRAIDTVAAGEAAVRARKAALAIAERALDDTVVRAAHAGRVVGLTVSAGEMVAPSQALFTLVNTEEWFAVANFRETELAAITPGECATVYSMLDRRQPLHGIVQGIGAGVLDTDRINLPRSLPYVERSLNWVRVQQRFPVRIKLEEAPAALLRLGASAVVEVGRGDGCH